MATTTDKLACAQNPCASCPYRKDTPAGVWSAEEYKKLPAWDEQAYMGGVFLCHHSATAKRDSVCRGWLEVHHRNFSVRLGYSRIDPTNLKEPTDVPLYSSGAEACRAGLRGVRKPTKAAILTINKLTRARELATKPAG